MFYEPIVQDITAVVCLNGELPEGDALQLLQQLAAKDTLLVAADGGARLFAHAGITPHIIMGDGDSLKGNIFPEVKRESYPAEKDFTDGEAAMHYGAEHTGGLIAVYGAFGGRIDHQLGNIQQPIALGEEASRVALIGNGCLGRYCLHSLRLKGKPGDTVSLLPIGGRVEDISLEGFYYPLQGFTLEPGSSRCLSNVLTEEEGTINISRGCLLAIHWQEIEE